MQAEASGLAAAETQNEEDGEELFMNTMRTEEDHMEQDANPFGLDGDEENETSGSLKAF